MTPKQKIKQIILLVFGLSVAHLGVTFFIQANLGTDPFNVLVQGIFRSVPWPAALNWTHGRTHMMICFLIIMVLLFIDRSYIRIGTIICMFLGGPIIDLFTVLLGDCINSSLPIAAAPLLSDTAFCQRLYASRRTVKPKSWHPGTASCSAGRICLL